MPRPAPRSDASVRRSVPSSFPGPAPTASRLPPNRPGPKQTPPPVAAGHRQSADGVAACHGQHRARRRPDPEPTRIFGQDLRHRRRRGRPPVGDEADHDGARRDDAGQPVSRSAGHRPAPRPHRPARAPSGHGLCSAANVGDRRLRPVSAARPGRAGGRRGSGEGSHLPRRGHPVPPGRHRARPGGGLVHCLRAASALSTPMKQPGRDQWTCG